MSAVRKYSSGHWVSVLSTPHACFCVCRQACPVPVFQESLLLKGHSALWLAALWWDYSHGWLSVSLCSIRPLPAGLLLSLPWGVWGSGGEGLGQPVGSLKPEPRKAGSAILKGILDKNCVFGGKFLKKMTLNWQLFLVEAALISSSSLFHKQGQSGDGALYHCLCIKHISCY